MTVTFETAHGKDEQLVYMSDFRGWFTYDDLGHGVWSAIKAPTCRIPGHARPRAPHRLGVEHPKGYIK